MTGLLIQLSNFLTELERVKKTIIEFDLIAIEHTKDNVNANGYKVSFVGKDGKEVVRSFDKTTYSNKGKPLYK